MLQYVSDIKHRVDAIRAAGSNIEDEDIVLYTLNGLPTSYNAFKTAIRTKKHTIHLDELYSLLCSEEVNITGDQAFRGRGRGLSRGRFHNARGGHASSMGGRRPDSHIECKICLKPGHSAANCWHRGNFSYQANQPQAYIAHDKQPTADWFLDSGASSHLTADASQLHSSQPYVGSSNVQVGSGHQLPITHSGQGILPTLTSKLILPHILHVPHLTHNLLSVHRLTHDNPCYVLFHANGFLIKDSTTHQTLLQGSSCQGLYPIKLPISSKQLSTTKRSWHLRLGHPSANTQKLLSTFCSPNTFVSPCDSCIRAKSHREPFSLSLPKTTKCLELVHTYVWGPAPVLSVRKFKYYLVFVDDFTRYCWVYPLKFKSEVLHTFLHFKLLVEKQFQHPIKMLQSDRGGEFVNSHFNKMLQ
ncbi:Retrovirus-related Pol polyprotein from transposon TNT 1-94 [Dendrobium catenatum]|uniref:Retrovirus-related Pol polyprotein from transposon TNT 1-94 n=1 Tax=Dendrobium catenatum TaxID=906689 RepID=A0A2I0X3S1_9ASPA|nr:Retrovirus-related Pol polyprotein from transposon TNT 1-94 [Dendrobium catenatum]